LKLPLEALSGNKDIRQPDIVNSHGRGGGESEEEKEANI
jgi:hypothetical protein